MKKAESYNDLVAKIKALPTQSEGYMLVVKKLKELEKAVSTYHTK